MRRACCRRSSMQLVLVLVLLVALLLLLVLLILLVFKKNPLPGRPLGFVSNDLSSFLEEMERRSLLVASTCRRDRRGHAQYPPDISHLVASKDAGLLYCPVPRAASQAWVAMLLQHLGQQDEGREEGSSGEDRGAPSPQQVLQPEQFSLRLLVVRHPLERLLSGYRDKLEDASDEQYYSTHGRDIVASFRERPAEMSEEQVKDLLDKVDEDRDREQTLGNLFANPMGPTFTEFVKYVVEGPQPEPPLWRPHDDHCAPCSVDYNFILWFENLGDEGPKFLQHIQAPDEVRQRKENVFNGPPTLEVSCSYYSQLSPQLLQQLLLKYEPDMQLFGYTADQYLKCADEYVKQ